MNCSAIKTGGSFTIVVDRIGAVGTELPFQLFGASDGVHAVDQAEGSVKDFSPALFLNGVAKDKVARFNTAGDLEIIDTNTGLGVKVSCSRIPYKTLLELIKSQSTPNAVALTTASTKITYTKESSRSQQLSVRGRSYFETLGNKNYEIDEHFKENQEQSNIVRINEVIDIMPVTKIDSFMSDDENKLIFTFSLQVV